MTADADADADEEEYQPDPRAVFGADGKPRVLKEMCGTCVFHPGNVMDLLPGRLKGMVREAVESGTWIVCHHTLPYHPDYPGWQAICRGFFDSHGHRSQMLRVAMRLGGVTEVELPTAGTSPSTQGKPDHDQHGS